MSEVLLPLGTVVIVKGFANASYSQRITVTPATGQAIVLTGSGENNNLMGTGHLTTPTTWTADRYPVTVTMEYSSGGAWRPSLAYNDYCYAQTYNLEVTVAEDAADGDYNDAVCMITWSEPRPTTNPRTSETVYLTPSTRVVIQSFANSEKMQRVTITPESGTPIVFQGQGMFDTSIGTNVFSVPAHSESPRLGFKMTVNVDHSTDNGATWQASKVKKVPCVIRYYHLQTVASEDGTDDKWDEATTYFTWTTAPPR